MSTTPAPAAAPPPSKLGLSRNVMIGIGAGCGCLSLIVGIIVIVFIFAAASGGRQQGGGGGQQQGGGGGQQQGGGGGQQQGGGGGQQQGGGGQPPAGNVPGLRVGLRMVKVTGTVDQPQAGEPADVFSANELVGAQGQFEVVEGGHDIVLVYLKQEGGRVVPVKRPQQLQVDGQMQGKSFTYVVSGLPAGEYGFAVFKVTGASQTQFVNGRVFRVQ